MIKWNKHAIKTATLRADQSELGMGIATVMNVCTYFNLILHHAHPISTFKKMPLL